MSLPYLPGIVTFINTGVYFLQAYAMVEEIDKQAMTWFALALAAVHIGLSRIISRREPANFKALRLLHLALAVALITIAIPIRLDGHWITVGWLNFTVDTVLLNSRVATYLLAMAVLAWFSIKRESDFDLQLAVFRCWR